MKRMISAGTVVSAASVLLALLGSALLAAAEPAGFSAHWEGAILLSPAEVEIPFALDIPTGAASVENARVSFPTQGVFAGKMESFEIQGTSIRFVFKDSHDTSLFAGRLLADGSIEGTLTEGENVFPFRLERTGASGSRPKIHPPGLHHLSAAGTELKELFNRDRGKIRLLLIVSPSCGTCKDSSRIVQKYVLDTIDDPRLRIYVVWSPVQKADSEQVATEATSYLYDPRATHFWAADQSTGYAFKQALSITFPAWDVFLLFDRADSWQEGAPKPTFFMHNLLGEPQLPKDKRLNGVQLSEKVRAALQALPSHS